MTQSAPIPVFALLGETDPFPDVVHCEAFSARAPEHGWRIPAHRHQHLSQLFLIFQGELRAITDGTEHSLTDGMFLFIPAQTVHEFTFRPDTEGQVISFPASLIHGIGPAPDTLRDALSHPVAGPVSKTVDTLTALLRDTMAGTGIFRTQTGAALAHSVLSQIAEHAAATTGARAPSDARLTELDTLISRYAAEGWTLPDYARALSVTAGHLSRLCRAATGQGASAYIERAIMEEACRMLAFTRLPVSTVAYRMGYADPSYFSRRFRSVRGVTPSQYRKRLAG